MIATISTFVPAPVGDLLSQIDLGSQALARQVRHWHPTPPPPAELASARRAVDGLARLLAELAQHQEARP